MFKKIYIFLYFFYCLCPIKLKAPNLSPIYLQVFYPEEVFGYKSMAECFSPAKMKSHKSLALIKKFLVLLFEHKDKTLFCFFDEKLNDPSFDEQACLGGAFKYQPYNEVFGSCNHPLLLTRVAVLYCEDRPELDALGLYLNKDNDLIFLSYKRSASLQYNFEIGNKKLHLINANLKICWDYGDFLDGMLFVEVLDGNEIKEIVAYSVEIPVSYQFNISGRIVSLPSRLGSLNLRTRMFMDQQNKPLTFAGRSFCIH